MSFFLSPSNDFYSQEEKTNKNGEFRPSSLVFCDCSTDPIVCRCDLSFPAIAVRRVRLCQALVLLLIAPCSENNGISVQRRYISAVVVTLWRSMLVSCTIGLEETQGSAQDRSGCSSSTYRSRDWICTRYCVLSPPSLVLRSRPRFIEKVIRKAPRRSLTSRMVVAIGSLWNDNCLIASSILMPRT